MENEGNIIVPIIGYIISVVSPIIGLLFGAALVFFRKDIPLYQKHGRFIIFFAILLFVIYVIIRLVWLK